MNSFAKNASNAPKYNNSSLTHVDNIIITGNTLSVCDQIFERLQEYYTREEHKTKGYECFSIARLFYWALQDYVRPSFVPTIIEHSDIVKNRSIPIINEDQVIIVFIPVVIAEYHYIVACKSGDNYKIYSAFGANFIEPFIVPETDFIESCNRLLLSEYNKKFNLDSQFVKDWNMIVNYGTFETYIMEKYLEEINKPNEDEEEEGEIPTLEYFLNDVFRLYPITRTYTVCILTRQ
jgi:hypothetical protein